jgi:UDP-2,4-diacetamido-2,4,6-trideoxy-beta-L-altropyranose hydrolase
MNIVVRADASNFMGIGHVMRCLTLARSLSEAGHVVHFVCREHLGNLGEKILEAGHVLHLLPKALSYIEVRPDSSLSPPHLNWLGEMWQVDVQQTKDALAGLKIDWLIVDHYALDQQWESSMRDQVGNILVIDDLADRLHNCDVLVDQTLNQVEAIYKPFVPEHCILLTGTRYALLRPEFLLLRSQSLASRNKPSIKHIVIVFGGGDQSKHILDSLLSIQKSLMPNSVKITVVMAKKSRYFNQVNALAKALPYEIDITAHIDDMARLMVSTDLVIGAAGGASLERCCLGVPTLLFVLAENQRFNASALLAKEAVYIISDLVVDLEVMLNICVKEPQKLRELSQAASELVDGKGVERVTKRLQNA